MEKRPKGRPSLKDASADPLYQSTFLPIFQDAETRMKKAIASALFRAAPKAELEREVEAIAKDAESKIPKGLMGREAYIDGLRRSARRWIRKGYDEPMAAFAAVSAATYAISTAEAPVLMRRAIEKARDNPKGMVELARKGSEVKRLPWAEAKGAEDILGYPKELKKALDRLAADPSVSSEEGKRPITLWQRAELDVRHRRQEEMLGKQREEGIDLVWIATHPDCSKRCAPWQGKLFSLTKRSDPRLGHFKVGKVDGRWVYSLTDIMAQKDKYGYNNNIISGFNCRHRTVPYAKGTEPPKEYSAAEIREQRETESRIRAMEREIRLAKTEAELYNGIDRKAYLAKSRAAERAVNAYKAYCEKKGYAWREYRIDIRLTGR